METGKSISEELVGRLKSSDHTDFWSIVDAIGWGSITENYDLIKSCLLEVFTKEQILKIHEKAIAARKILDKRVAKYEEENNIDNLFGTGDDGRWDVLAHIVGLGKDTYNDAMENPGRYSKIKSSENFEYSFNV